MFSTAESRETVSPQEIYLKRDPDVLFQVVNQTWAGGRTPGGVPSSPRPPSGWRRFTTTGYSTNVATSSWRSRRRRRRGRWRSSLFWRRSRQGRTPRQSPIRTVTPPCSFHLHVVCKESPFVHSLQGVTPSRVVCKEALISQFCKEALLRVVCKEALLCEVFKEALLCQVCKESLHYVVCKESPFLQSARSHSLVLSSRNNSSEKPARSNSPENLQGVTSPCCLQGGTPPRSLQWVTPPYNL